MFLKLVEMVKAIVSNLPMLLAILTHNIKDYVVLSKSYAESGKRHFGIIVSDQIPFSELLRRTLKFLSFNNRKLIKNKLIWLQDYK